ncbi:ATP-binding protein [Jhaorihella thermophila]|nr:ATP-binding protein [Jhaorihella thermophila]
MVPNRAGMAPAPARVAVIFAVVVAALAIVAATGVDGAGARIPAAAAITAGLASLFVILRAHLRKRAVLKALQSHARFIAHDAVPGFVTDGDGFICVRNPAAIARYGDGEGDTLGAALRGMLADPAPVILRLVATARAQGAAGEEIVTRIGAIRLVVHRIDTDVFGWRIEDLRPRQGQGVKAMGVPVISIGRSGAVLSMNDAARALIGDKVRRLDRLFGDTSIGDGQIREMQTAEGPVPVVAHRHPVPGGRTDIVLIPLSAEDMPARGDKTFMGAIPLPMLKLDRKGIIREINSHAAKLLGSDVKPGDFLANALHGLGRPINDWLRETAEGRANHKSEFLRLARDGQDVFVQVTLTPVDEGGETVFLALLNDATELKTLEAQFVQGQKMQAIGQLAGGIAHDFNNLLTAISGHCDLLLLRHDQGDPDYGDLVQIHENANRAAALVSQLLAFSRKQTLRPQELDLRETLSDLTHLLNRLVGEKVTLTLSHDPVLRPIRADKRQLEQVLMNLVVNARDSMPDGGEIRIETEVISLDAPMERDRVTVPVGDYVLVRVSDQGVGIPPEVRNKIFEPFYTTKRTGEGTGLGLSTVYGIVKQTGGFIFVDSVPGQGSEFTLYFPASELCGEPAPEVPPEQPQAEIRAPAEGVILLVEDEAPVRAFAARALRLRGFTVIEAQSAEEALRVLEDVDLQVDVFVTDVVMPGMDGPSWVREALKSRPRARVVFMSGYSEGAFGESEEDIPNSVFLPKPFSLNQLTETVRRQLA